jgi:hypothetical protein
LDNDGADKDNEEEWVVKEVLENVSFAVFKFSSIDFVEDL